MMAHKQKKADPQDEQQCETAQQRAQLKAQLKVQPEVAAQAAVAEQQAAAPAPVAAVAPACGTDVVDELQKLASLKEAGVVSDEECVAAKAKLLG